MTAELADLDRMDPDEADMSVLAEAPSCDGPAMYGPFGTATAAHAFVVKQCHTGQFDIDSCTVEYRPAAQ